MSSSVTSCFIILYMASATFHFAFMNAKRRTSECRVHRLDNKFSMLINFMTDNLFSIGFRIRHKMSIPLPLPHLLSVVHVRARVRTPSTLFSNFQQQKPKFIFFFVFRPYSYVE